MECWFVKKIIQPPFLTGDTFISVWPMEYLFKKPPVTTKRATVILIEVKSWNALSSMLLVCIGMLLVCISILVYIKSVLRNKILILDASGHY